MRGRRFRRAVRASIAIIALVAGMISFMGAASAAGGEQGVLRLKGPGSVYSGSRSFAQLWGAPGASVTFSFQVKNTGSDTAQYNFHVYQGGSSCPCQATDAVSAGSLFVTKLAQGSNGYFTAGIDAGKLATYSLKVTLPTAAAGAVPGDFFVFFVNLTDTAGNFLDNEEAVASVTKTKGTSGADQFVSSSGTASNANRTGYDNEVSSTSVAIAGSVSFTVKLMNDSAAPTAIKYDLSESLACASFFSVTVKAGTNDVTALVFNGTYQTPVLNHAASTSLTVKVTYLSNALGCTGYGYDFWSGVSSNTTDANSMFLVVPFAATN